MNCDSAFIASHSGFATSGSPRSIASIARSIVGRAISRSSSSVNHRSATATSALRLRRRLDRGALLDLDRFLLAPGEPVAARWTAERNFSRLTSSVERISSA